jgi:hypothetical protein
MKRLFSDESNGQFHVLNKYIRYEILQWTQEVDSSKIFTRRVTGGMVELIKLDLVYC